MLVRLEVWQNAGGLQEETREQQLDEPWLLPKYLLYILLLLSDPMVHCQLNAADCRIYLPAFLDNTLMQVMKMEHFKLVPDAHVTVFHPAEGAQHLLFPLKPSTHVV